MLFAKVPDRFTYYLGEAVTGIDTATKTVTTGKRQIKYDKCVFSTGSGAGLPPYISMDRAMTTKGIFVYRNIVSPAAT